MHFTLHLKVTLHLALRSTFKARCKARFKVLLCSLHRETFSLLRSNILKEAPPGTRVRNDHGGQVLFFSQEYLGRMSRIHPPVIEYDHELRWGK